MAANQNVVDELVVKLTLDAKEFKTADKQVDQIVDQTEKKMVDVDKKRKARDVAQKKRNQETLKSVKELAGGIRSLALTVGGLLGIGSAAGIVGAVVALAGMETGLRRAAVSTGLSNRELQAYGSTIRRLGGDAQAGAQAVADLAKEQKQFNLTGNAPTLAAFQKLGINATPTTSIVDILAQAQQVYRAAPQAQKGQLEAGLSAGGVSPDLIVAIKSETDVREAYAKSYAESASENRKALDTATSALTSVGNAATNVANSILTIFAPQIEDFANWAATAAKDLSELADKVAAAGGGIDGLQKVLDEEQPELGRALHAVRDGFTFLAQAVDLATYGLKLIGEATQSLFNWIDKKLSFLTGGEGKTHPLFDAAKTIRAALTWAWGDALQNAHAEGVTHLSDAAGGAKLTSGAAQRIAGGALGGPPGATRQGGNPTIQEMASYLVSKGMDPNVALGLAVNAEGETWKGSGRIRANAVNSTSGASGAFQYLGPRLQRFKATHGGKPPDQFDWQTQADFLWDPTEQARLKSSLRGTNGVFQVTQALNDRFEANGLPAEGLRRAAYAQQLSSSYGGTNGNGVGQQFNIQSVTVQANTPQEFVGGLQRLNTSQNYNSAVR